MCACVALHFIVRSFSTCCCTGWQWCVLNLECVTEWRQMTVHVMHLFGMNNWKKKKRDCKCIRDSTSAFFDISLTYCAGLPVHSSKKTPFNCIALKINIRLNLHYKILFPLCPIKYSNASRCCRFALSISPTHHPLTLLLNVVLFAFFFNAFAFFALGHHSRQKQTIERLNACVLSSCKWNWSEKCWNNGFLKMF